MYKLILIFTMLFSTVVHAEEQVGFHKTYHVMAYYKGKPYKAITVNVNLDGTASTVITDSIGPDTFSVQVESVFPVKMRFLFGHAHHEYAGASYLVGLQPGEYGDMQLGNFTVEMERVEDVLEIAK